MSEDSKCKIWEDYSRKQTMELREKIILEYAGLVKVVAGRLSIYLGYHVEYDDLVGYGTFGLIDAIDKFDIEKGVKFETYASLRIRGAILDQIRKMDWIPRTLRQKQRQLDTACQKLEQINGRPATDDELASELQLSIEELENLQNQTKVSSLISLDEYMEQGEIKQDELQNEDRMPEKRIEKQELRRELIEVLELLTEKEKKVILLYYYEELTLKEISRVLEVSESRVSQLHTKALQKMRMRLGGSYKVFMQG